MIQSLQIVEYRMEFMSNFAPCCQGHACKILRKENGEFPHAAISCRLFPVMKQYIKPFNLSRMLEANMEDHLKARMTSNFFWGKEIGLSSKWDMMLALVQQL
jgi:hypothetical protein